jgi:hypothetical protein
MPLAEEIGECFLRIIVELVFHVLFYGVGFLFLKIVSFGTLPLAPFSSYGDCNPSEKKIWSLKWSIWLQRKKRGRVLKAECVILVGMLVGAGIGAIFYFT